MKYIPHLLKLIYIYILDPFITCNGILKLFKYTLIHLFDKIMQELCSNQKGLCFLRLQKSIDFRLKKKKPLTPIVFKRFRIKNDIRE